MRTKDDKKQEALFLATIKIVNEIGFAASSVAKIAKEAGVSPATLYIYFNNKEDLLVSTYVEIKQSMGIAMLEGFDEDRPLYDTFHRVWHNTFDYVSANKEDFRYAEQFSNSPFSDQVDKLRIEESFEPLMRVIQRGKDEKVFKDVELDIFGAFMFFPIMKLANPIHCKEFQATKESVETAYRMAWDAVKL